MDKEEVKNNLKFALKILKIVIIIMIKLCFSRFLSELALLPLILYKELVVYIPFKIILLISISAFIYVNWAIWTKGVGRKVLMLIVMFFYLITGAFIFSELAGIQSDYCIEDGDCEEGYMYRGRPFDEEYCKELNGEWIINPKHKNYCKLKTLPQLKE